jgi:hypothetical protein
MAGGKIFSLTGRLCLTPLEDFRYSFPLEVHLTLGPSAAARIRLTEEIQESARLGNSVTHEEWCLLGCYAVWLL